MIPPKVREELNKHLQSMKDHKYKSYIVVFNNCCDAYKRFNKKNSPLISSYLYYNRDGIAVFPSDNYARNEIWIAYLVNESFWDPRKEYIPKIIDRTYVKK